MRRLVILRHAKAITSVPAGDHARHLNPRGLAEAAAAGWRLRDLARVDFAWVSDARRTRETFDRLVESLGHNLAHRFEPRLYGASVDEILSLVHRTASEVRTLLIVGHNPGIGDLARKLTQNSAAEERRDLDLRFPTSSFAIIGLEAPEWSGAGQGGTLESFVVPHGD